MTTTATFAAALRGIRKGKGMTAQTLSDQLALRGLHYSRSSIGNLESGVSATITLDLAVAIAEILDVPLAVMLAPLCETCAGLPPAGFTCNACGAAA